MPPLATLLASRLVSTFTPAGAPPLAPPDVSRDASPDAPPDAPAAARRRTFLLSSLGLALAGCSLPEPGLAATGRLLGVDIVDRETGDVLDLYTHAGRAYVAGRPGSRYAIRVTNRSGARVLAVMSVDGINVLTGKTAAWNQSGYVFEPWQTYEVTGWRKSNAQVAAFEFTSLPDSYAARTGRPLDVGVIGLAAFRKRARPAWREPDVLRSQNSRDERERRAEAPRNQADPAGGASELGSARSGAGMPAPAAPAPSAKAQADSAFAERADRLGTGHGRREDSWVTTTQFERASSTPDEIVGIQYDRYENLLAAGIIVSPPIARPRPFPGSRENVGYVPDPPARY